ncbi:hypothetical protein [Pseudoflavonifractor phocaeensis]|uniref:hypothetical protein n=1 Tax=Pseudoflavonifractor phocaeensis TaxID=1870988 RepID=UPI001F194C04|nr:hypothetical protein [Pseudoflavonifractor phocaeensis]MCF2595697.1 hypothetical protein [Pseudoflavonifractor phocaeensis]
MKRILVICFCIVIMTSLGACKSSAVKAVEQAITSIGIVTIDSENAIEAAENAYSALSDKEKAKVSNYSNLIAARSSYNAIPKPIQLTVDNYSKYINLDVIGSESGSNFRIPQGVKVSSTSTRMEFSEGLVFSVTATPISNKYEFSDVVIELKVDGKYNYVAPFDKYKTGETEVNDMTFTIELDISGNGFAHCDPIDIYGQNKWVTYYGWISVENVEVVSVTGTLIE